MKKQHVPNANRYVGRRTTKLNPFKFALAAAIIMAIIIFAITLTATLKPGTFSTLTSIISDIYKIVGYSVSTLGAFLGAIYSFIDTFIIALVFAWLYNKLL